MVPALLGKVEDFHIKDDASDHAFGEEFAGDITDEEFEATLGVLDTADGDGPAEDAERLAEKLAVEGLAASHVGAIGLDTRPDDDVCPGIQ